MAICILKLASSVIVLTKFSLIKTLVTLTFLLSVIRMATLRLSCAIILVYFVIYRQCLGTFTRLLSSLATLSLFIILWEMILNRFILPSAIFLLLLSPVLVLINLLKMFRR